MKKKHPELYAPSLKRDANATDVQVHQAGNDMHELDEFIVIGRLRAFELIHWLNDTKIITENLGAWIDVLRVYELHNKMT